MAPFTVRYAYLFSYELYQRSKAEKDFNVSFVSGLDYFTQSLGSGNWDYDSTLQGELKYNYSREIFSVLLGVDFRWEKRQENRLRSSGNLRFCPQFSIYGDVRSYYQQNPTGNYIEGDGYFKNKFPFGALIKYDYTYYLKKSLGFYAGVNFQWYPTYNLPLGLFPRGGTSRLMILGLNAGLVLHDHGK